MSRKKRTKSRLSILELANIGKGEPLTMIIAANPSAIASRFA
jgi:hypothetical protein